MVTEEIINYIKNELTNGVDIALIRENLIKNGGWSSLDIDEAMNLVINSSSKQRTLNISSFFFRFLLFPILGLIFYNILVSVGSFLVQYIIYNFVHWEGFGDVIMMLMWTPVIFLVPLIIIYFFLKKFGYKKKIIFLMLVIYPVLSFTLNSFLNQYQTTRYDTSDTCNSVDNWDCQSDYHLGTFIPLSEKAERVNDLTICRGAKNFKDYSTLWSESRCIAGVFQFNLPDIDGDELTIDYVGGLDSSHECLLRDNAYVLSGLKKTKWSETDIKATKTIDSGDIFCFYEYPEPFNLTKDIIDDYNIGDNFYTFDNILIQYIGSNSEIIEYLKSRLKVVQF